MGEIAEINNPFKKAERRRAMIKMAITGPSGSGKTMSALRLMRGFLGPEGKIALIDTENDSASLYSDVTAFDALNIEPPYTTEKYIAAIRAAIDNKYDGLVIDTISHAWAGEGGLIDQKEAADARGGAERNKFTNWGKITKKHEEFKAWLLKADVHMICTMRSKQDYVLGEGNKPQKVGMAPIQRDGMEYEFTTVFDLAMNHSAMASKDRTKLFDGRIIPMLTEDVGITVRQWHGLSAEGIERPAAFEVQNAQNRPTNAASSQGRPPALPPSGNGKWSNPGEKIDLPASEAQRKMIWARLKNELQLDDTQAKDFIHFHASIESSKDMTRDHVQLLVKRIDEAKTGWEN